MTGAQRQAAFLRALADHLDRHPHLAPVWIYDSGVKWRLQLEYGTTPRNLADWAESLGATELVVTRIASTGATHLHAHGYIGGHTVDMWNHVPALDDVVIGTGHLVSVTRLRELP